MKHASLSKRAERVILQQVEKAVNIIERVHSEAQGLFLFHNAPSHRKVTDDDLNADKKNVGLKGKHMECCAADNCTSRRQGELDENDSGGKGSGEDMRKIWKTSGF